MNTTADGPTTIDITHTSPSWKWSDWTQRCPPSQEKRVYRAFAGARARTSGRFYYQSHDITETVANQTTDSLECGYYHNTTRVLYVYAYVVCVCVRAHAHVFLYVSFYYFALSSFYFFSHYLMRTKWWNSCPRFLDCCILRRHSDRCHSVR